MTVSSYRRNPVRDDVVMAVLCLPLYLAATGKYGLRIPLALAVSVVTGLATEAIGAKIRGKPALLYGFPCWILMPLVLPPMFPVWMTGVSVFFAAVIGVVFFGGYGRQLASPVAIGWSFAALSYPKAFGFGWTLPFPDIVAGFSRFAASVLTIDHPIDFVQSQRVVLLEDILAGYVPQTPGNSVPALLIVCGLILYILRAVDIRSSVTFIAVTVGLSSLMHHLSPGTFGPPESLLVGNFMLAGFFIYADRRVSPRTNGGRWVTAALAGMIAFLIRSYSTFPCGVMFAVLFGNVFSPIIDEGMLKYRYGRGR